MNPVPQTPSPEQRDKRNALAFLSAFGKSCGRQVRLPNYYTLNCMKLLDMVSVEDGPGPGITLRNDRLSASDLTSAYMFIHAAPPPDVERAVRAYQREQSAITPADAWDNFMADHVAPFMASLTPEELTQLEQNLESLEEIEAARVDATPPTPVGKPEIPDPNS